MIRRLSMAAALTAAVLALRPADGVATTYVETPMLAFQAATYDEAARERTPVERRAMLDRTTWPTSLRRAAKLGMQRVDERSNVRQMRFFFAQHEVECLSLEGLHVEVGEGLSARRI